MSDLYKAQQYGEQLRQSGGNLPPVQNSGLTPAEHAAAEKAYKGG